MGTVFDPVFDESDDAIDEKSRRLKLRTKLHQQSMDSVVKCRLLEELFDWSALTKDYVVFVLSLLSLIHRLNDISEFYSYR